MKASRYNIFHKIEDDTVLAFNSGTGALAEIEPEQVSIVERLLQNPNLAESERDKDILNVLIEGGYLIGDGIDEVARLRSQAKTKRLSSAALSLTIAPTLLCNFDCEYCYERQSSVIMTESTQAALLEFSERQMSESSQLLLSWYGGEPTLCMPVIERLQSELRLLAEENDVEVQPASIISNGYLLDGETALKLNSLGITEAQITLDGSREIHNKRRKLHDGRGTFDRIVDNLSEISRILDTGIRINVDRDNVQDVREVFEILRERGILSHVRVYFAPVNSSPGAACADMRDRCFGAEEFSRLQVQLYRELLANGIYTVDYPQVSGGISCGAVSARSFVVSPNGLLFKCWEQVSSDPEDSIGSVFSAIPDEHQRKNMDEFRSWDPFEFEECRECVVLPICMGGCPLHSLKDGSGKRGLCSPWKYNLPEMLELRYRCRQARESKV